MLPELDELTLNRLVLSPACDVEYQCLVNKEQSRSSAPVNGLDVDSLLDHLPQRRQISEACEVIES